MTFLQQQQQQLRLQQQQILPPPLPPPPPPPGAVFHAAPPNEPIATATPTISAPPSPIRKKRVSLTVFCEHYSISEDDAHALGKLGYVPGNKNVRKLSEASWKEAGFSELRWLDVLDVHDEFVADARAGKWSQPV